jgi:hypothetical protein
MADPTEQPVIDDPNPTPDPTPAPKLGSGANPTPTPTDPNAPLDFNSEDIYNQFRASLPEDLREKDFFKNTKNLSALAKQAVDAQSALGKKRLPVPQDDWQDADWEDFYAQLRPETADKYTAQEKVTVTREGEDAKDYAFDEATTTKLRETAHSLGLTDRQFQSLQKVWAENAVQSEAQLEAQISQHVQDLTNTLRKDWGQDFQVNHRAANEAFEALITIVPELEDLVNWSPVVANHPAVMKLFHTLSPLVKDLGVPSSGNNSGFGSDTVAGLKAQIEQFDSEHGEILYAPQNKLATMTPSDKAKRERLLAQRTELYKKLYPTK